MRRMLFLACFMAACLSPKAALADLAANGVTPTVSDLQDEIQGLSQQLNQLEISTEMAQGRSAKMQNPTFGLAGGSFEQDFEANSDKWSILQGQTLRLRFFANPMDNVTGHLDLELWGNVASDIFAYDSRQLLVDQGQFFAIREFDTTLSTSELSFTAFKGMPIGGYYQSRDDLYRLFPDQYDVDKYFRISGQALPEGLKVVGTDYLDGLEFWAGYQLQWGIPAELYGMYQHKLGGTTLGVIDRFMLPDLNDEPNGPTSFNPVTATTGAFQAWNTLELTWKIPVGDWTVDAAGLYKPLSPTANTTYTYANAVAAGTGTDGSNYDIHQGTIKAADLLGGQVVISSKNVHPLDSIMVNGEYSGLVAGDLERISGEITEIPFAQNLFTFDVTVQQPLIGPAPNVEVETIGPGGIVSSTQLLSQTRGQFDPFQVTSNPITGINNRQMTKFALSYVYNPGAGWFFRYNPNDFGAYNVNTDLDTPFSLGLAASAFDMPTGTDSFGFVDAENQYVWEAAGASGQAPTDGYQTYEQGWLMFATGPVHWVANMEGGFSQSALSYSTAMATPGASSTDCFISTLSARLGNTSLMGGYDTNIWGPEDWDRQFGVIIGQRVVAQISQKWGASTVALKYESWSNYRGDAPMYEPATITNDSAVPIPTQELYTTVTVNF